MGFLLLSAEVELFFKKKVSGLVERPTRCRGRFQALYTIKIEASLTTEKVVKLASADTKCFRAAGYMDGRCSGSNTSGCDLFPFLVPVEANYR